MLLFAEVSSNPVIVILVDNISQSSDNLPSSRRLYETKPIRYQLYHFIGKNLLKGTYNNFHYLVQTIIIVDDIKINSKNVTTCGSY